jgi:hypothetical protein
MLSFAAWNACCQRGEWSHFINLSGQDFPLKPQKQIIAFLNANLDREFIKVMDQHRDRPIRCTASVSMSSNFFARKFDQTVDGEILGVLEEHLADQSVANAIGRA